MQHQTTVGNYLKFTTQSHHTVGRTWYHKAGGGESAPAVVRCEVSENAAKGEDAERQYVVGLHGEQGGGGRQYCLIILAVDAQREVRGGRSTKRKKEEHKNS